MGTQFYEVEVKNRVVKGKFKTSRIKGTQGQWYQERLYFLADNEQEVEVMALEQVKARRILGIAGQRKQKSRIRRQAEIVNIRRVA